MKDPSPWGPFEYWRKGSTPKGYVCSVCGDSGVRLWRQSNTIASCIELMCRGCALKNQTGKGHMQGLEGIKTDCIGWLVPAVPTEEGNTFWGYTSVPPSGVKWWYSLPSWEGAGA